MKKINKWTKYFMLSAIAFCGLSGTVTYSNELATKQFLIERLDLAEKQLTSVYGVVQSILNKKSIQYAQLTGLIKERYNLICKLITDIEGQLAQDTSKNHTELLTKTKQLLEMWEQLLKPLNQILKQHLVSKRKPTDFASDLRKVKMRLERKVSLVQMEKIINDIEKLTAQDPELSAKFKGLKQQIETQAIHTAKLLNNMGNMAQFRLLSTLYNNR